MKTIGRPAGLFVVAVVALSVCAQAQAIDPFKCYKARDLKQPAFVPTTVALDDDLDVDDGDLELQEPNVFCNPADLNGVIARNPVDHLTCYPVEGTRIPRAERPRIAATDQFGTVQLELYKPASVCVTSKKEKTALRQACTFGPGALPDETLDADVPRGEDIPIDHIVMLMQENRSFDHYFGQLPTAGHPNADGHPADASNPDAQNDPVFAFHSPQYCIEDVAHSWNASHLQYNGALNDGFVVTNVPDGERAMGYLDDSDLPFYYGLAKTFAMGDRLFCSVLGPTYPNRFYYLTGTSDGRIRNEIVAFTRPDIFDRLQAAGVSFKIYAGQIAFALLLGRQQRPISQFFADAAAGTLPQVSYVDPDFFDEGQNDEHPPSNPQRGQQFVESVYNAIVASPNWPSTALIISYDEHGGFYDHVPPPSACVPDAVPPDTIAGDVDAQFDRYGFRVPLIVVSPWAKPGYVSHHVYDLTSILRFVETRFELPALTKRDANATPITDLFDFSQPQLLSPPPLPVAVIDPVQDQICESFQ